MTKVLHFEGALVNCGVLWWNKVNKGVINLCRAFRQ